MLYPTTKIQFMDVNTGKAETLSVDEFYRKYFYRSEVLHGGIRQIHFERHMMDIKIRDNEGWTNIKYINLIPNEVWMSIHAADKSIIITPHTFIPVYDEEHPETGFHGEVKYPYILMHPEKIVENNGKIRVIKGIKDNKDVEFADVFIDYLYSKKLNIKPRHPYTSGYEIITKSRFFNAEGIHLFGAEELTFEEYDKWYPHSDDKKS